MNTAKAAWCWNFSAAKLNDNIRKTVHHYNEQMRSFQALAGDGRSRAADVDGIVDFDPTKMSWSRSLRERVAKGQEILYRPDRVVTGAYRPFCKQSLYFDRSLIEMIYQQPRLFPGEGQANVGISLTGAGSHFDFCALMTDSVPDYHLLDTGQFFPRYTYEKPADDAGSLFESADVGYTRVDNITDEVAAEYQSEFGSTVTKDDIFYFVYGLLHSSDYRERYGPDLNRMLPRIPWVRDFAGFAQAGRRLAELHLGYESADPFPLGDPSLDHLVPPDDHYLRVEKMVFGKGAGSTKDRSKIVYNRRITLSGIPDEAYRYMLGPKSAVEWVMDRYQVKTDKPSGIVNDPNDWCDEVGDPRYIIDLVKRIVTVSIETMKIVDALPPLEIIE